MPYGYGVGFIKATSDIPLVTLRGSGSGSTGGQARIVYKIQGTNVNYQVPEGKTAKVALERTVAVSGANLDASYLGYADDVNGTNFVSLGSLPELDIHVVGNERYWVLNVPAGKFIIAIVNPASGTSTPSYTGMLVLIEV
jgi:hypothetical protein